MRLNKKLLALVLAVMMVFSSTVVFADNGDVFNRVGNTVGTLYATAQEAAFNVGGKGTQITFNGSQYLYELDGKYYSIDDLLTAFSADTTEGKTNFEANLKANYKPVVDGEEPPVGDLEVISISAINSTTIKVVFDNGEEIETTNFEPSPLIDGTNTITFTYKGIEYETEVYYEKEIQEPRLEIEVKDEVIAADGLSKTMVIARLFDEEADDESNLKVDGLVTFTTTRGDFAQPQVSFDQNGEAALQLTSEVSTKTITAYITATVTNVPGFPKYEGIVAQSQVRFAPVDELEEELKMVTMVDASASQADRINVTFSGPVTKADIVKAYKATLTKTAEEVAREDGFGFRVDGSRAVLDVRNVPNSDNKILELILYVENAGVTPELRWNSFSGDFEKEINGTTTAATGLDEWPSATDPNGGFLRDNMKHNVSIPVNTGKVVANPFSNANQSGGVNFILTDISKPWIAGVKAESQKKLIVRFSEAMSIDKAEELTAGIYDNFRIDGKRLMQIASPGAPSAIEKNAAQTQNLLLVDNLKVQPYFKAGKAVDERHLVVIDITAWNRLAPGEYSLQASNVGDWAAMTHSANMLETQTFDFEVKADDKIPTATIEMQSPEQWLITFDMPVKLADLKADEITQVTLEDAIKIYPKDEWVKPAAERTEFELTNAVAPSDHYQVTAVDEDGRNVGGGANGYAPGTTGINGVKRLLVEFKKDWTAEYKTATTKIDYFHSTKSPYTVVLNHWLSDGYENAMPETVLKVATPLDAESPTIKDAVDMKDIDPTTYTTYGEAVYVEMSEPVQLRDAADSVVSTPLTESEDQALGAGIPIPTFQFVKGDTVIPGSILGGSIPQTDNHFIVKPDTLLTAGTWTLIIRSISDDVGNTSATVTKTFVVEEDEIVVGDTRIAWVGFDNEVPGSGDHDYVYVKFTKVMKSTGANGVARTTNFTLNNNPLPQGSEIIQGIKNIEGISPAIGDITNDWDGLTIKLPKTAWDGTDITGGKDFTVVFGVASNFEAADGERLSGPYTVQLNDTNKPTGGVLDGDFDFEAEYLNGAAANLIDGKAVVKAEGLDTNGNGKIDRIVFNSGIADSSTSHKITVNGVTFVSDGSSGYDAESKELDGTVTNNLVIKSVNGAIIVNNGNAYDAAGPQVISAKAANLDTGDVFKNDSTITITFSEAIDRSITSAVNDWDDITGDELDAILAVSSDEDANSNTIANVFGDGSGGDYATGILSADDKTLVIKVVDATTFNTKVTDLTHYIYAIQVAGLEDAEGNVAVDLSSSTDLTGATPGKPGNNVQIKK